MFGHEASTQTVCSPNSRTILLVSANAPGPGAFTRSQSGLGGAKLSGRFTFSGWRGRIPFNVSSTTAMRSYTTQGLNMDHPPISIEHALVHHFRERRMREHGVDQLCLGGLQIHRDHEALN